MKRTIRIDIDSADQPAMPKVGGSPSRGGKGVFITARGPAFKQLLASVYDAVLITGMEGAITEVNPRASDFFLYNPDELLQLSVLDIVVGSSEELLGQLAESVGDHRYTVIDAKCIRKDGSMFSAEIAVSHIGEGSGMELCFFVRDLSVRKQAEKSLREALQRLERHDKARSMFVSNITHELRTPLTSIMYGVTNLLKGIGGPLSEKAVEYLGRLERECTRLLGTVNDILDLERLDAADMMLARVKVPLSRLVMRACDTLKLHAEHKGVELTFSFRDFGIRGEIEDDEEYGFTLCDPIKMERVMLNIVGNAVKYTPSGGRIDVTLTSSPEHAGRLVVSVVDTGIGIPPHALESVTERYYRVGETADGSGLGLAIACEIVEKHGGELAVISPPLNGQQGTLVSVSLSSVAPPVILIVDDEAGIRKLLAGQLNNIGYGTTHASGVAEALESIRDEQVDLIVLDWLLPDGNGIEVISALRDGHGSEKVPIVILTGAELDAETKQLLGNYSVPIVTKPWRADELLDAIEAGFLAEHAV